MAEKDFVAMIKNLQMGRVSWIIQTGPKCNHMDPSKREAEGIQTQKKRR